jgi:anti-anti-sigma factor
MSSSCSAAVDHSGTNSVEVTTEGGVTVLKLCGDFDIAMAPNVRRRLAELNGDVELDCAGLTFMGAAGITLFSEIHRLCRARGAKLTVVNAPRCVTWLLALTELDDAFEMRARDAHA